VGLGVFVVEAAVVPEVHAQHEPLAPMTVFFDDAPT